MGTVKRFGQRLWRLTAPRTPRIPVVAISDSHAHFCEGCRCYVSITLWQMDFCPNCEAGSDQLKFASAWMRTPGEQAAHTEARTRKGFVKAINDGVPKRLPQQVIRFVRPPDDAA